MVVRCLFCVVLCVLFPPLYHLDFIGNSKRKRFFLVEIRKGSLALGQWERKVFLPGDVFWFVSGILCKPFLPFCLLAWEIEEIIGKSMCVVDHCVSQNSCSNWVNFFNCFSHLQQSARLSILFLLDCLFIFKFCKNSHIFGSMSHPLFHSTSAAFIFCLFVNPLNTTLQLLPSC